MSASGAGVRWQLPAHIFEHRVYLLPEQDPGLFGRRQQKPCRFRHTGIRPDCLFVGEDGLDAIKDV